MSTDNKDWGRSAVSAAGAAIKLSAKTAKALGSRFKASSAETKSATAGGVTLGTVGLATGSHIGIAALGTAISGSVVLPVAGAVVGALAGYSILKAVKDKRAKSEAKTGQADLIDASGARIEC